MTPQFKVGQLVQVKPDASWSFAGSPAIIISGARGYYQCAVASDTWLDPLASGRGWYLHKSELLPYFGSAAKPIKARATRKTLTPSAAAIAAHLAREGNVSGVEAAAMYKTRQLPGRISELRNAGYDIASYFDVDRLGQRYVRYHLVKAPEKVAA